MQGTSDTVRFATFNASLNRNSAGQLVSDLSTPDNAQAKNVAEIIQRSNPDVILINEFDYEASGTAANLFRQNYLAIGQNGAAAIDYPYVYVAPSNTGIPSGTDFNNNGAVGGPDDALGFGFFPGQYGMVIYSKYAIDTENIRTFQTFLWKDMPGALLPDDPNTPTPQDWYSPEELEVFRLSSKSHWDIPIEVNGETIHVLASHPTPPVFDGPEDRNGKRNHDEIRFWADYITPGQGGYIYDDNGNTGGLAPGSRFVIMGDQNADPLDGDSFDFAIRQLTDNPLINNSEIPDSAGGVDAAARQNAINDRHRGNPAFDTADFADTTPGNLRADYVLPSRNLNITEAAVFWPTDEDPLFRLVGDFNPSIPGGFPSSDHRLVWTDVAVPDRLDRNSVSAIDFLGEVTFPTSTVFADTQVGGLSGIAYDPDFNQYYSISDDRSQIDPARFYTLNIDLSDGALDQGDVSFTDVTTLLDESGSPFAQFSLDPEGIALTSEGTVYLSSEGEANPIANRVQDPFIREFDLATGSQRSSLSIPEKFLPSGAFQDRNGDGQITNADQPFSPAIGIRNNLALESLTITPNGRYLYTATENALSQDGAAADLGVESPSRILQYDLTTGEAVGEFLYVTDPVAEASTPATAFRTNGLVELLAIDNSGTLLSLERSFSTGAGNTVKLYEVKLQGATDISSIDSLNGLEVDVAAQKRLLLNFDDLGLTLDNIEGMTLGSVLPDGRQSLIVVSDNNFSDTQFTQFLSFAIDLDATPGVEPVAETPPVIDLDQPPNDQQPGDADDPAIYVHPLDPSQSLVVSTLKDGGLSVYDLTGSVLQTILPGEPGDVRYNNVDLVYGFRVGDDRVDLAVASDRENDTLAIYAIDPTTRQLSDITSASITESIFGIDDGEQTAYGLATYTSPVTGRSYVFVSQREGDRVAQLELVDDEQGGVAANLVRTLTVPIPATGEREDAQVEGMVVDRDRGILYVGQEQVGIYKFSAEPDGDTTGTLIESVDDGILSPDVEGLTIYYADNGTGYLLASSQGDSTYAVFSREGNNEYLGSFAIGNSGDIDSVEESDGADVINVPLGEAFPFGLLVVQDGNNDPALTVEDEGEVENVSSNFKFVPWQNVAAAFPDFLKIDRTSYDPRTTTPTTLPNGIASGDTTQDSTVLWTRSTVTGTVTFEYSTDANFGSIAGTVTAEVTDPLAPVKVQITGLAAGTDYYYRVTDAAGVKLGGEFTTSAEAGTRAGLRFGVSGDWRGELSPYPAIRNAADRDLEFFVEHGDTIYADYESPVLPGVEQARTLEEYRLKHSEVYGDRLGLNTWADLRRSTSILATIDDHEVINDFAGGAPASEDPRLGETEGLVNDTQLYENGLQAFQDYNPIRDDFYGNTGEDRTAGERQLYRYNTYGNDAASFILDARSFRDEELSGVANPADPTQVGAFLARSFDIDPATGQPTPRRTMLGQVQLNDLKTDLLAAERQGVTWKFVMVPEPIQNLGVVGASDRFEGYAAERTDLLKFINDQQIDNVVFVAADIHGTLVNNLTYQVAPGQAQIATSAFEITTGAVAFDAPFGQSVAEIATQLGVLDPATKGFYDALPIANDADDLPNDKDDFIKQLVNAQTAPFGYDPLGLDDNLSIANGAIEATLLQGDYVAAHTYGWTEFDINPLTQKLTVTTYGIDYYTEAELQANSSDILSRSPRIVSQFEVNPNFLSNLVGNDSANRITGGGGGDRIDGKAGNDTLIGGLGNDELTGGSDNDLFVIRAGDGFDTITDFGGVGTGSSPTAEAIANADTIRFEGEGLVAENLLLTQAGANLVLTFEGVEQTQVVLQNFRLESLDNLLRSTGATVNLGNLLFDGETRADDSFDVFNANSDRALLFNRDTVTFLNDLDNQVNGFNASRDVINAQGGNDRIDGLGGADLLRGGDGNDVLIGSDGNDLLDGGAGADELRGGQGRDRFVLTLSSAADTIADFEIDRDLLQLSGDLTMGQVTIAQGTNGAILSVAGQQLAILTGVAASSLSNSFAIA
jgi:3-phytase/alkaline phosphatase D